jgi:seryl-tRNA synthetase
MAGLKLYEVSEMLMQAYEAISAIAEANNGEIQPGWESFYDEIQMERDEKAVNIARWVKNIDAEADAIRAEERKLAERRRSAEAHADRLRNYLAAHLPVGTKITDSTVVIGWRKSSAVEVDEGALPAEWFKIVRTPMKSEIKDAIKAGAVIPGASIHERQNLSIK